MDELDQLLPDRNLRVGFLMDIRPGLKPALIGPGAPPIVSPFGAPLEMVRSKIWGHIDSLTREISIDLGNKCFPFCIHWYGSGQYLWLQTPETYGNTVDEGSGLIAAECNVCYYFEGNKIPCDASRKSLFDRIRSFEENILDLCAFVPDIVKKRVGGDLPLLCSWPKALLNIALRDIHPTIRAHVTQSLVGKGYHGNEREGLWAWKEDIECHESIVIRMEPDYYTATKNAIDSFRYIARSADRKPPGGNPEESTNQYDGLDEVNPAARKAYYSFLHAEAKEEDPLEDRAAYDWIHENGFDKSCDHYDELEDYKLPPFDTWCRYLRIARKATGEQKYTPRHGRATGRSIVSADEIEHQHEEGN